MADERRLTVGFDSRGVEDLNLIQDELGLNITDSIRKGIALLALHARKRKDGDTPAFIRPDGSIQEIYFL